MSAEALVDVDEVVAALMPEWLRLYNADFHDTLTPADILGWDLREFVKPEARGRIYGYLDLPYLYHQVRPIQGAQEGIQTLRRWGYRVTYVTQCSSDVMVYGKVGWLRRHGFLAPATHRASLPDDVVILQRKELLVGDFLVDDNPEHVERFYGGRGILFDRPNNRGAQGLVRAVGWAQVLDLVQELRRAA